MTYCLIVIMLQYITMLFFDYFKSYYQFNIFNNKKFWWKSFDRLNHSLRLWNSIQRDQIPLLNESHSETSINQSFYLLLHIFTTKIYYLRCTVHVIIIKKVILFIFFDKKKILFFRQNIWETNILVWEPFLLNSQAFLDNILACVT